MDSLLCNLVHALARSSATQLRKRVGDASETDAEITLKRGEVLALATLLELAAAALLDSARDAGKAPVSSDIAGNAPAPADIAQDALLSRATADLKIAEAAHGYRSSTIRKLA
jgi:hypothetical protein